MTKEETMQSSLIMISKEDAYSSSSFSIYQSYIAQYLKIRTTHTHPSQSAINTQSKLFGSINSTYKKLSQSIYILMELESLEEKQKLLRDEIIGKEVDAEAFMEFMGRVKGEGDNIDLQNWTISELNDVIRDYHQFLSKNRQELLSSRISRDLRRAKIFTNVQKEKVKYEGTSLWDYQQSYLQECARSELAFEIAGNVAPAIGVQKWEIKSVGGFIFGIGARNELELTISSNFTQQRVVRKDEDCDWLRNILISKHAGSYVPPLEAFKQLSSDDKRGVSSRIADITSFLNALLTYPAFHYSPDFKQFLTQTSYKDFADHKVRESAFAVEKDLLEIDTPSGSFNVIVSEQLNSTIKQSAKIAEELCSLYGELQTCFGRVVADMEGLARSHRALNDATAKIGEKYSQVQLALKHQTTKLPTILLAITESSSIMANTLKSQIQSLSALSSTFVKPTSKEWGEFLQFTRRHQWEIKSYLGAKEALLRKKERCLADPTKWELSEADFLKVQRQGTNKLSKEEAFEKMLPSDNDKENRTKIWLSFVNQSYLVSFKQFLSEQERRLLESYLTFAEKQAGSAGDISLSYEGFRQIIGE